MKRIMLFSMFCGSLLASYAMAAELYVDQNNPAAADKSRHGGQTVQDHPGGR